MGDAADDACDAMFDEMDRGFDDYGFDDEFHEQWSGFGSFRRRRSKPTGPGPCPICNGPTTQRTNRATQQTFYGCCRFPECRGTRNCIAQSEHEPEQTTKPTREYLLAKVEDALARDWPATALNKLLQEVRDHLVDPWLRSADHPPRRGVDCVIPSGIEFDVASFVSSHEGWYSNSSSYDRVKLYLPIPPLPKNGE